MKLSCPAKAHAEMMSMACIRVLRYSFALNNVEQQGDYSPSKETLKKGVSFL